ncbi:MAG: nucleotidyltransferase family protein [Oscillospiraceae bacterium]|nr:nucleotidyltransferase family protein [Oscillospiraceae bacterium]
MNRQEYRAAMENVIYLSRCAVNGVNPGRERVGNMDLAALYAAADRHMMTAVVAMALESAGVKDDAFVKAEAKSIRKSVALDGELRRVAARLEAAGIWYMPLKGAVMKNYYPRLGMRQMADCDVLFDPARAREVREIMEDLGYTAEEFGKGHHDLYTKAPMYVMEMHRHLFDYSPRTPFYRYYADVRTRLIPDGDHPCRLSFSDEDFYLYLLAHEYNHYTGAGIGLRANLDIYVFWKRFSDSLDRAYIAGELKKLDLSEFERKSRELATALFGDGELSNEGREILENHLLAGRFGSEEHRVKNGVEQMGGGASGRLQYALGRLFPSKEFIQEFYPYFWRHKLLLPFLPLYRLVQGMVMDWPRVRAEIKALFRPGGRER